MNYVYLTDEYSQQRQRQKKASIYPVVMAMEATYRKAQGHVVLWNKLPVEKDVEYRVILKPEGIPLNFLPSPDRIMTDAHNKKYQSNGNFKRTPATYMMSIGGCIWGNCSFCVERDKGLAYRSPDIMNKEVEECFDLGFKEIFDDSATMPASEFLYDLCHLRIASRKKMMLGCNMRIDKNVDFSLMKKAGYRMVLFGVESFNQDTLDKIHKGIQVKDIIPCLKKASDAGLEPHIAVMTGYPWETYKDEMNTIRNVQAMLRKGYAKTAQVSLYDVAGEGKIDRGTRGMIYDVCLYPDFWVNKIKDITGWHDFVYLMKCIKKGVSRD